MAKATCLGTLVAKGMSKGGKQCASTDLTNKRQVALITVEDVESFLNTGGIKKKAWESITRDNYGQNIRTFFNLCIRKDFVKGNPCSKLDHINVGAFYPSILWVDESVKLLNFFYHNHSEVLPLQSSICFLAFVHLSAGGCINQICDGKTTK